MQAAMLVVMGALVGTEMRRITFFRRCGIPLAARRRCRRMAWALGLLVWGAMLTQEGVLLASGMLNWRTGLPLHLCSLTGLLTLPMLLTKNDFLWHFSLCLGLPGAVMALLFPAVPQTVYPRLAQTSFFLLHVCLILSPLLPFAMGKRPSLRKIAAVWAALMVLGAAVTAVNALLGSNYLFLNHPVPGTPLEWLAQWGEGMYRLQLGLLATLLLTAEGLMLYGFRRKM